MLKKNNGKALFSIIEEAAKTTSAKQITADFRDRLGSVTNQSEVRIVEQSTTSMNPGPKN